MNVARRTNCLLFALRVWRWRMRGAWIAMRRSLWGPFPHFCVLHETDDWMLQIEYVPQSPSRRILPPPLFRGRIKRTVWVRADQSIEDA